MKQKVKAERAENSRRRARERAEERRRQKAEARSRGMSAALVITDKQMADDIAAFNAQAAARNREVGLCARVR